MSLSTCSEHGIPSDRRCPICHKPLCGRCKTRDGCCSERCYASRQKFGASFGPPPRRPATWPYTLFKLALLAGLAYGAARYFGIDLPFDLPF